MCFGLLTMEESYRLSLGVFRKPGEGFLSFWAGAGVTLLSVVLLIRQYLRKSDVSEETEPTTSYAKLFTVLLSLLVYVLSLEWVGFLISTFLWMAFLLRTIEPKKWWVSVLVSFLGSLIGWLIFKVWLGLQLPKGILPF